MKKNLLLLVFALVAGRGFSQNVDSLVVAQVVDSLLNAADNLRKLEKSGDAVPFAQQAADISKQHWGEKNALYALSLHRLAGLYAALQQNDKAEELYLKAIELRRKLLSREDLSLVASIQNLANLYLNLGDFDKAEPLFIEIKEIKATNPGPEHPEYATALFNLGRLYWKEGDYAKAEPLYLEAKEIWGKTSGMESSNYSRALIGLAVLYAEQGDFSKAEPLFEEAKTIEGKVSGKETQNYAALLNNLSNINMDKGDYAKAILLYQEAIVIWRKIMGENDPDYINMVANLALVYDYNGDYAEAERLLIEATGLGEKNMGSSNPEYANILNTFAVFYVDIGEYAKAKTLCIQAKDIFLKSFGKENQHYTGVLTTLGDLYLKQGDYDGAEALFFEAKEIGVKISGKESETYALYINNLATVYESKGEYSKAESLLKEAVEIRKKALGKEHPLYATSLLNLANVYADLGEYSKAEPLYLEAKEILEKSVGAEHPDNVVILFGLAVFYQETKRIPESTHYFIEMNGLTRRLIEASAAYSSEIQMLAYLHTFEKPLNQFQSFAETNSSPKLNSASFDNALFFNGFLLENARYLARSVAVADSLTRETYKRWQGCRRRLSDEYARPIAERGNVAEVEAEADAYEKTLTSTLPTFSETRHVPQWQEVQAALKPGEAAVEFIHFQYYTLKPTDSTLYAALVLRSDDTAPQFISLFEKNELKELMRGSSGGSNFLKINALYSQKSLYDLIWKPLEPILTGVKTVYCAPSGLLHRLNLAAMATPKGKVYGERRQVVVLGSTRSLAVGTKASQLVVPNNSNQINTHSAFLAGGIRYDSDSTAIAYANRGASSRSIEPGDLAFQPDSLSITRGGVLDYLPATATEVREIGQTLSKAGFQTKVDTGFYATEESFRQLGVGKPSPRIIHLATHGYFFPDPAISSTKQLGAGSEPVFKMSEHPMIRSGLIMAGAKQSWLTGKHPEGQEDGILTAYEISQMNLSGTELVVLSACETDLGDIVGNEGVYGLQRAFKIAGAKYLIMSLWKVDDQSTRAFMTSFYRHWLTEKETVPEAFRSTQREMRAKYSGAYDWAGFVLIE